METFHCPPNTRCLPPGTGTTDYLRMRMGHGQRYTQMYTTKELQTGEYWDASVSTGLEMYDFDARFYDPQLGRWFVPDPAEQYPNGYLAIGNDPVNRIDPDGRYDRVSPFTSGPSFSGSGYNTSAFSWFSNNFFISYGGRLSFTPPAPMRTWLYHPGGVAGAIYRYEKHHWANNYGAHKGSFAPFSYRGQIYRYNSSRGGWGYEREYGAALGTSFHFVYFPNDPTPRVLTKPLFGVVNQWVGFGAQSGVGDPWATAAQGGLMAGELARQGKAYQFFGSSAQASDEALAAGKYIHNGDVYWQGNYRGVTNSMTNSLSTAMFVKATGRTLGVLGAGVTLYQAGSDFSDGRYKSESARIAVGAIAAGAVFIPVVGWGVSVGISVADAIWGDDFYNWLEN